MTQTLSPTQRYSRGFGGFARLLPARSMPGWSDHLRRFGRVPAAGDLASAVTAAGLNGRGGAGFPMGQKIATVASNSGRRRPAVVVVNCCEGDPTSSKDAVLLTESPHLAVDGGLAVAASTGADRVVFAVHEGSSSGPMLERALAQRDDLVVPCSIVALPTRFIASEASSVVRFLNSGDARPAGRFAPIWESGVDGRPTLVGNAETMAHVALIARYGPDWFRQVGTRAEPGTLLVTVGGAVARPGVVEVPGGTSLRLILQAAGWPPHREHGPAWALVGGLAGRWIDVSRFSEVGFSGPELAAIDGTKGVGSIVALPAGGCLLAETARIMTHLAEAGARQCGPCMFGLPAIAGDMTDLLHGDVSAFDRLKVRLPVIDKRGGCGHPDGAVGLARSAIRSMRTAEPDHLRVHLRHGACNAPAVITPLGRRRVLPQV